MPPPAWARRYAGHALALAFLLALYWQGLHTWFYQDDFGWLNLRRGIHSWQGLAAALFAPKAHGNMRPLGENAYFLFFSSVFGVDPLPFRIWAFLTQAASVVLLGNVVRRLTGSGVAAFAAQVFWIANTGLAAAMCWTSIYNQILCGFLLLLAFYFLLRYVESGDRRFHIAQWAAFLLSLGALETAVVYPALAASYTWLRERRFFRRTLPLFAGSLVFAAVHFLAAPPPAGGVYSLHLDAAIFRTLATYWAWALGPARLAAVAPVPPWLVAVATVVLTAAILGSALFRREPLGLWALGWFLIVLGPYLPLRDHVMDYYLAVPAIGLAIFGGWAICRAGRLWRIAAACCAAIYLAASIPAAHATAQWHYARSQATADLVLGVAEVHRLHPGKTILLTGVSTEQFWASLVDVPFRAMEIPRVYLAPDAAEAIQAAPTLVHAFTLPEALALRELAADQAVVYRAGSPALRNVTAAWRATASALWRDETPRYINPGDTAFDPYLGPGWEPALDGRRTMGPRASLRVGGPRTGAETLHLLVFGLPSPDAMTVSADGRTLRLETVAREMDHYRLRAALPPALVGRPEIWLGFESGARPVFGFVEVR